MKFGFVCKSSKAKPIAFQYNGLLKKFYFFKNFPPNLILNTQSFMPRHSNSPNIYLLQ
uniref:Uncharacterized protein n=1 Tax=Meloidogyne enterolobii TaxID=390850 RepID=A0A6V7UA45_MELEN|nr:unnamed protein product [Meloidogyne enterolobii]